MPWSTQRFLIYILYAIKKAPKFISCLSCTYCIEIEIVDHYHYLGATVSSNGTFLKNRKHVAEQATKELYLLFSRSCNANLPTDLIIKLFDHTVLPIVTYEFSKWNFLIENLDILEKVDNNFLRKLTKQILFLYGELVISRMIFYWYRLITGK